MRFGLLGEHPDAVDLASALIASGRHTVVAFSAQLDDTTLARLGNPHHFHDAEEVLADPLVEAVLVGGSPGVRPQQLRRALQSERHVFCVHPADEKTDSAYEAGMIRVDTGYVLAPILPERLHPALSRLAEYIDRDGKTSPVGAFRLLQYERHSTDDALEADEGRELSLPGWDLLRLLGGELVEVSSFTDGEELRPGLPVLLAGRFEKGGLFQVCHLPAQRAPRSRFVVIGTAGRVELLFPVGFTGPAELIGSDGQKSSWPPFDPWPSVVAELETILEGRAGGPTWDDEIRALELDDAARRSVERRRVNLMDYQEASEEVGFKGTMTLVGCAMFWAILLMLIVARWLPWVGWLILPLLVAFIALQFLRYVIPSKKGPGETENVAQTNSAAQPAKGEPVNRS